MWALKDSARPQVGRELWGPGLGDVGDDDVGVGLGLEDRADPRGGGVGGGGRARARRQARRLAALRAGRRGQLPLADNTAIPYSQLDDDYCDCADGSDEPGTSACPNGRFYCANRGFRPKTLYASHVNDGVSATAATSDEHASGAGCANTCEAEGAEGRKAAAAHLAQVEAGLAEAARRAAAGAAARATARAELDAVVAELAAKRAAAEALEKQKSAAEEVEAKLQEEQRRRKEAEAEAAAASEAAAAEARRAACARRRRRRRERRRVRKPGGGGERGGDVGGGRRRRSSSPTGGN